MERASQWGPQWLYEGSGECLFRGGQGLWHILRPPFSQLRSHAKTRKSSSWFSFFSVLHILISIAKERNRQGWSRAFYVWCASRGWRRRTCSPSARRWRSSPPRGLCSWPPWRQLPHCPAPAVPPLSSHWLQLWSGWWREFSLELLQQLSCYRSLVYQNLKGVQDMHLN